MKLPDFQNTFAFIIGIILGGAGVLKALHESSLASFHFFHFSISLFELWIATLCFFGSIDRWIRVLLLVFFAAGVAYNAYLIAMGFNDCGCFGSVSINPIFTFAIDILCFAMAWIVPVSQVESSNRSKPMVAALFVAITVTCSLYFVKPGASFAESKALSLLCKIDKGKPFQFANRIAGGRAFMKGHWKLLLFRANCNECVKELDKIERNIEPAMQVAMIEIPPLGSTPIFSTVARYSHLDPKVEWDVETPMWITLVDGLVVDSKCPHKTN
jgi:hypothetical protein